MERLTDLSPFDWLEKSTAGSSTYTYERLVPAGFDAYCKVFHPVFENPDASDETGSWGDSSEAAAAALDQFTDLLGDRDAAESFLKNATISGVAGGEQAGGKRVRWMDLAAEYGLEFHPGLHDGSFESDKGSWPVKYFSPEEGDLAADHVERIVQLLATDQRCFFLYSDTTDHRVQTDTEPDDWGHVLYSGTLDELPEFISQNDFVYSPSYWWPEDKSWCINSDWDLTFTAAAGTQALVQQFLDDDLIEAVPVTLSDEYMKDRINAVRKWKRKRRQKGPRFTL